MARWLHTLQQFQFSIVHRAGRHHGNAYGLSRVPTSPCGQCARVDCPLVDTAIEVVDQPFDAESVGDSEDADLVPIQSGEDWVSQLDNICPDRPPSPVRTFTLLPFNFRILRASHYWRGSGRMFFPLGRRLRVCGRSVLTDMAVKTALIDLGPRPITLHCLAPCGALHGNSSTALRGNLVSDILVETRVHLVAPDARDCGFSHVWHFSGGRSDTGPHQCVNSRHRRPYSGRHETG